MSKSILPFHHSTKNKEKQVEVMFDSIAKNYNRLNKILSLRVDRSWRLFLLKHVIKNSPKKILDVATGTGDMIKLLSKHLPNADMTGIDLSEQMLEVARKNMHSQKMVFQKQSAEKLSFSNETFDAITVTFGIRNFENLEKGLTEIHRVLQPKCKLYILEFGQPQNGLVRWGYHLYSSYMIPFLGGLFSGNFSAYSYLVKSSRHFPCGEKLTAILHQCGFKKTAFRSLSLGICYYYEAEK